ncbi:sugar phosphate isomerase/epimerase family protein [Paenibacillus cellulositrophicus]|uniref:sugar phosphate isomerase/epimerase family protein n=1 Tax=Paenibacillus cellulositrophicus TaxID=562959 RepID=UPI001267568C|nr:sugar phosphate isomerase/epimerase family protein [Paenibacillus cellulositrophicus]
MIRGLTRAGIGHIASNEQFIVYAVQFGFQSVDLNPADLIREVGMEKALHLLESNNIVLGSFDMPVDWRSTEEAFLEGLPALVEQAKAAKLLGGNKCCTYILPSTDQDVAPFMIAATRRLRLCADILAAYGIRFGLEFVGSWHLREEWANPFIWTLDDTLAWIDTIQARNVGLLFDSYHWHTNGLGTEAILKLKPEQIVHVHLNDAKNWAISELMDGDRLYPGEGAIDLTGFLSSLGKIGYKDVVAQEVLSPLAAEQESTQLLARSQAGFNKAFAGI